MDRKYEELEERPHLHKQTSSPSIEVIALNIVLPISPISASSSNSLAYNLSFQSLKITLLHLSTQSKSDENGSPPSVDNKSEHFSSESSGNTIVTSLILQIELAQTLVIVSVANS